MCVFIYVYSKTHAQIDVHYIHGNIIAPSLGKCGDIYSKSVM